MTDYAYFKDLTPRQQLNDLMHKYAQEAGGNYGDSWRELDRRWKAMHGDKLSWLRWKHNQENQTALTLPAYIEATGKLTEALAIGHEITGGKLKCAADTDQTAAPKKGQSTDPEKGRP